MPKKVFHHSPSGISDRELGETQTKTKEYMAKFADAAAKSLENCRHRISEQSYGRCLVDIEMLRNPEVVRADSMAHWTGGQIP